MFLGVDLGTSSVKLLLADHKGLIVDSVSSSYPDHFPQDNWSEQDPEDWWKGFLDGLALLKGRHDLAAIEGISFSGQMHGLVILDQNDQVIRPAILWNDNRTGAECAEITQTIGKANLIQATGNIALPGFTAPKLLWVKHHEPENFRKIAKIMLPKDFLAYRLTGKFVGDVSDASGTLLYDVENKRWSARMLDFFGMDETRLPRIVESQTIIGAIPSDVALATGLSPRSKVVIGGGDQAMGAIGTGTIRDGMVSISLGTSGVIFIGSDTFRQDENASLHAFCHANGKYHLMGVTLACAGSAKWWIEDILGTTDYASAMAGIDTDPISEVLFLPYLIGERSPINDPDARGSFANLSLAQGRKDLTKAVIEGICFSLKDCLDAAKRRGISPKTARVIGGGAKSDEWLQILSDVTNLELRTINTSEGGGLGAILVAMTACGAFASIEEACQTIIRDSKIFLPDPERHKKYAEKFKKYQRQYANRH